MDLTKEDEHLTFANVVSASDLNTGEEAVLRSNKSEEQASSICLKTQMSLTPEPNQQVNKPGLELGQNTDAHKEMVLVDICLMEDDEKVANMEKDIDCRIDHDLKHGTDIGVKKDHSPTSDTVQGDFNFPVNFLPQDHLENGAKLITGNNSIVSNPSNDIASMSNKKSGPLISEKLNNNFKEVAKCGLENEGVQRQSSYPKECAGTGQQSSCIKTFSGTAGFVEAVEYADADIMFKKLFREKSLIEQVLALQSGGSIEDVPDTFCDIAADNSDSLAMEEDSITTHKKNELSENSVSQTEIFDFGSNNRNICMSTHMPFIKISQSSNFANSNKEISSLNDAPSESKLNSVFSDLNNVSTDSVNGKHSQSKDAKFGNGILAVQENLISSNFEKNNVGLTCRGVDSKTFSQHAIGDTVESCVNNPQDTKHKLPSAGSVSEDTGKLQEDFSVNALLPDPPKRKTEDNHLIRVGKEQSLEMLKEGSSSFLQSSCDLNDPRSPDTNIHQQENVVKAVACDTGNMECDINQDSLLGTNNSTESTDSSMNGDASNKSVIIQYSGNGVKTGEKTEMYSLSGGEKVSSDREETKTTPTDPAPVDYIEPEFVWEDYLTETGTQAALPESFLHVETSLKNGFEVGQVVELPNKDSSDTYWLGRIVTVSGQLLGLCVVNSLDFLQKDYEDEDSDRVPEDVDCWCDAFNSDIHPFGWCAQNGKIIHPTKDIECQIPNLQQFLSALQGVPTPASYLFKYKSGTTPIDLIKVGHWLEVQEEMLPTHVWPVRVIENVGGRLLLRYEGAKNAANDFWLFYLNIRLHTLGWAKDNQHDGYQYTAPQFLTSDLELQHINWGQLLTETFTEGEACKMPVNIFQDQESLKPHIFKEGMKLEALHPQLRCAICPATVTQVFNRYFFKVQIDTVSNQGKMYEMCCHQDSPCIFPVRWCTRSGLRLIPPLGWDNSVAFDWKEHIQKCDGEAAPDKAFDSEIPDHEFIRGMKLEAVDPDHPAHLCVATIVRIVEHLMWLHLDTSTKIGSNHIVDVRSHDVFPVGWCESNEYPLKLPRKTGKKRKIISQVQIEKPMTADEYRSAAYKQIRKGEGSDWCPKIYFNHLCFSGGLLSKGRIADLPRSVGPGPVNLVMKEVLTMLVNVAYKSSRVLRELQLDGPPNPTMIQQVLKAKHKGKRYRAVVEICKDSDQIEEFCRRVCITLECCPLLISPYCVEGECPEVCSQLTKTKYTACYLKNKPKRKHGRPPGGGYSNLEGYRKAPGGKRKRRRGRPPMTPKDPVVQNGYGHHDNGGEIESVCGSLDSSERLDDEVASINRESYEGEDETQKKKRKYDRRVLPPTTVKTRGVKLPSYRKNKHERSSRMSKVKDVLLTNENRATVMVAEEFIRTGKKGRPRKVQTLIPVPAGSTTLPATASGFTGVMTTSPATVFKPIYTFKDETTLKLTSNPLHWTVQQVVDFIRGTDSAQFAKNLKEQEIDGQALLMLSLPVVQEYLDYKLGPALKLCHHIERLKLAFYQQYA